MSAYSGSALGGKKLLIALFLGTGLIFSLPVLATDIYVSDTGSDSDIISNGTQDAPYATVTKALTVITGGDTIYCRGTIVDNPNISSSASGTESAYTTITNWPSSYATINGGGPSHNSVITINDNTNYIRIDGLNITNAAMYGIVLFYASNNNNHVELTNNNIYGLTDTTNALYIYLANTSYALISGNHVYGTGTDQIGITIDTCPNSEISGNKVHDFYRNGIAVYNNSSDSVVANNWIYNIGGTSSLSKGGILASDTYNLKIYNNVLFNLQNETNLMYGINLEETSGDTHDISIRNNIFSSIDLGIECDGNAMTNSSSDYNVFYSVTYIADIEGTPFFTFNDWQTTGYQDANGMEANPLFASTDPAAYDFHVQAASPAIDAGLDTAEITTDYDNEARPYNITDIGADEMAVVAAPESLTTTTAVNTANISWQMPEGYSATSYNIRVSANSDLSTPTELSGASLTSLELTSLISSSVYYYAVQAVYATDYASYSSEYSEISMFVTLPTKVKKVAVPAKYIGTNQAKIKWQRQNRATGYQIKVMNAKGKKLKMVKVKTNKKYRIVQGLLPGRTYKIKVRARKTVSAVNYWGKWSKMKKFQTLE